MRPAKGRLGSKMGNCLVELPRSEIERANALDDTSTPDLDAALHEKLKGYTQGVRGLVESERASMLFSLEGGRHNRVGRVPAARMPATYLENCIVAKVCSSSRYEGHAVDALAPGAEEGRGRLR